MSGCYWNSSDAAYKWEFQLISRLLLPPHPPILNNIELFCLNFFVCLYILEILGFKSEYIVLDISTFLRENMSLFNNLKSAKNSIVNKIVTLYIFKRNAFVRWGIQIHFLEINWHIKSLAYSISTYIWFLRGEFQ